MCPSMNAERLFKESDVGLENADIFRKPAGEGQRRTVAVTPGVSAARENPSGKSKRLADIAIFINRIFSSLYELLLICWRRLVPMRGAKCFARCKPNNAYVRAPYFWQPTPEAVPICAAKIPLPGGCSERRGRPSGRPCRQVRINRSRAGALRTDHWPGARLSRTTSPVLTQRSPSIFAITPMWNGV